jgi:hypothetical protein
MVVVGRIGIPYNDFFILNYEEREALVNGFNENQKDNLYAIRVQTFILLEPHLKKDHGLTLKKMWPFNWELEDEVYFSSSEDFRKANETIDLIKKIKNVES